MKSYLSLLIIFIMLFSQSIEKGSIKGQVRDGKTKELLIGVNVSFPGSTIGASTDLNGEFEFKNLDYGSYQLQFDYIGYQKFIMADIIVKPDRITRIDIKLQEAILSDDVVEVTAAYFQKDKSEPLSVVSFSTEEIRRSPGAGGEITRILNALPSVASRGEDSQDLMVRGGSPIENQFLIDNIIIPSVKHFETASGHSNGPIGIINTALVNDVKFYSGGFNAAYGGVLSSVTDVSYRDGNKDRFDGEIGMDFTGFSAIFEGPYADKKGTWFLSARRSYLDLISNAIGESGAPRFEDIQSKWTYDLSEQDKVTFLAIYALSSFDDTDLDNAIENEKLDLILADNESVTLGMNWMRSWNKNAYSNLSVSGSIRDNDLNLTDLRERLKISNNDNYQTATLRNSNSIIYENSNKLDFGIEASYEKGRFDYFYAKDTLATGQIIPDFSQEASLSKAKYAAYASYSMELIKALNATIGMRYSMNSLNEENNFAPRLNLSYQLDSKSSLNLAYSRSFQDIPLFLASQNASIKKLNSMQSDQYVLSYDRLLSSDTKMTVEVFSKNYSNMPQGISTANLYDPSYPIDNRFGQNLGILTSKGEANSYGVELLVQKKLAADFYGMISASYFRSLFKDQYGDWQKRVFDNQYLFNIIGGYKPNDTWELSVRWSFIGGRPYTPIDEAASSVAGIEVRDMYQFNDHRLADYHSLYIRYDHRFFFEKSSMVAYMTLWNAYANENVNRVFWNRDKHKVVKDVGFSLLPVMGVKYEF